MSVYKEQNEINLINSHDKFTWIYILSHTRCHTKILMPLETHNGYIQVTIPSEMTQLMIIDWTGLQWGLNTKGVPHDGIKIKHHGTLAPIQNPQLQGFNVQPRIAWWPYNKGRINAPLGQAEARVRSPELIPHNLTSPGLNYNLTSPAENI